MLTICQLQFPSMFLINLFYIYDYHILQSPRDGYLHHEKKMCAVTERVEQTICIYIEVTLFSLRKTNSDIPNSQEMAQGDPLVFQQCPYSVA